MSSQLLVEVRDIGMSFGSTQVLHDLSTRFTTGMSGILGPNGAGKTTFFRIITGGLRPKQGTILWQGQPISDPKWKQAYQREIGFLPQDPGWYERFSVYELCSYFAGLRKLPRSTTKPRVEECIEMVGLSHKATDMLKHLSGGERRRAFLAQTLVHDPQIIVLDEPTAGLDPVQRIEVRRLVSKLASTRIVLLSTHLVEDVIQTSEKILILKRGTAVWEGSPEELTAVGKHADTVESTVVSLPERGFLSFFQDCTS